MELLQNNLEDVDLAILEVDGNISVLSNNFANRSKKKRLPPKYLPQK